MLSAASSFCPIDIEDALLGVFPVAGKAGGPEFLGMLSPCVDQHNVPTRLEGFWGFADLVT